MNPPTVFTEDGVIRRWVDKRTGEEVENLLKWRKTTGISWSRETEMYPAKVWVYFFGRSGEKAKLWFSFDTDSEAEQAFEKADALRDAYLRREQTQRSPAGNAGRLAKPAGKPAKGTEDLRPPSIENLGEPPEYDPSDTPF